MSVLKKRSTITGNPIIGIAIGCGAALIFSILISMLMTGMINSGKMSIQSVDKWVILVQGISSLLGAYLAAGIAKKNRIQVCVCTAGIYLLCLLATTALLFGGQYRNIGWSLLAVLAGGGIAALSGIRTKNGRKIKALKRSYR